MYVESLPTSLEELRAVTAILSNKLLNEKAIRLNVEEEATHLISKEEGVVGELVMYMQESQVKDLERKLI